MKLGDATEKVIKVTGLNKLASSDCGCEERKRKMNEFGDRFKSNVLNKLLRKWNLSNSY